MFDSEVDVKSAGYERLLLRTEEPTQPSSASSSAVCTVRLLPAYWEHEEIRKFAARGWDAIVACSRGTNVLAGDFTRYAQPQTVVIGCPMQDNVLIGAAGVLSSEEHPPCFATAAVGVGKLSNAVIAAQRLSENYSKVLIVHRNGNVPEELKTLFDNYGVTWREFDAKSDPTGAKTLLAENGPELPLILQHDVDQPFRADNARALVCMYSSFSVAEYLKHLGNAPPNAVFVGAGKPRSLGYFALQILAGSNEGIREKLMQDREAQRRERGTLTEIVVPLSMFGRS